MLVLGIPAAQVKLCRFANLLIHHPAVGYYDIVVLGERRTATPNDRRKDAIQRLTVTSRFIAAPYSYCSAVACRLIILKQRDPGTPNIVALLPDSLSRFCPGKTKINVYT